MFKWLFKPVKKIGDEDTAPKEEVSISPALNLADEILTICDIDEAVTDVVKSRILLCMNTDSIDQLFSHMISKKDVQSSSQVAISLGLYFQSTGLSPSECLIRLSKYINDGNRIPSKIKDDLITIRDELKKLKSI